MIAFNFSFLWLFLQGYEPNCSFLCLFPHPPPTTHPHIRNDSYRLKCCFHFPGAVCLSEVGVWVWVFFFPLFFIMALQPVFTLFFFPTSLKVGSSNFPILTVKLVRQTSPDGQLVSCSVLWALLACAV